VVVQPVLDVVARIGREVQQQFIVAAPNTEACGKRIGPFRFGDETAARIVQTKLDDEDALAI